MSERLFVLALLASAIPAAAQRPAPAASPEPLPVVAVLPFRDEIPHAARAWFINGRDVSSALAASLDRAPRKSFGQVYEAGCTASGFTWLREMTHKNATERVKAEEKVRRIEARCQDFDFCAQPAVLLSGRLSAREGGYRLRLDARGSEAPALALWSADFDLPDMQSTSSNSPLFDALAPARESFAAAFVGSGPLRGLRQAPGRSCWAAYFEGPRGLWGHKDVVHSGEAPRESDGLYIKGPNVVRLPAEWPTPVEVRASGEIAAVDTALGLQFGGETHAARCLFRDYKVLEFWTLSGGSWVKQAETTAEGSIIDAAEFELRGRDGDFECVVRGAEAQTDRQLRVAGKAAVQEGSGGFVVSSGYANLYGLRVTPLASTPRQVR